MGHGVVFSNLMSLNEHHQCLALWFKPSCIHGLGVKSTWERTSLVRLEFFEIQICFVSPIHIEMDTLYVPHTMQK
jgi:hypothetical protein